VGFAMIFGFGPAMLAERGWAVAAAGTAVSIVMWLTMLSVPAGGFIADWSRRHITIIVAGCVLFAGALLVAARTDAVIASLVVLGIVCGVPAGPIMSLPARVLAPETRAVGMGIYFTVYYTGMFVAPPAAGWLAARLGGASAAFDFGAAAVLCAALLAWVFPMLAAVVSAPSAATAPGAIAAVPGAAKP
jgi:MFS family permease